MQASQNLGNQQTGQVSGPTSGDTYYTSFLKLDKGLVTFEGYAVQLKNISHLSNYPVTPRYNVGVKEMLIAVMSLVAAFFFPPICILGLIIIGYAIWERSKPKRFALTIQMNSGHNHYFVDTNRNFIDKLYRYFVSAIANNQSFQTNFIDKQIVTNIDAVHNTTIDNRIHDIAEGTTITKVEGYNNKINNNNANTGTGGVNIDNSERNIGKGAVTGDISINGS